MGEVIKNDGLFDKVWYLFSRERLPPSEIDNRMMLANGAAHNMIVEYWEHDKRSKHNSRA